MKYLLLLFCYTDKCEAQGGKVDLLTVSELVVEGVKTQTLVCWIQSLFQWQLKSNSTGSQESTGKCSGILSTGC